MKILYLEGDKCAPKYVQGAMEKLGLDVKAHVAGELDGDGVKGKDLYVLSDYPADHLGWENQVEVLDAVRHGAGLLMVGGWTSYGRGGYHGTQIERALPVSIQDGDDRENTPSGMLLDAVAHHPLVDGLAWEKPPVITGRNVALPDADAEVLLLGHAITRLGNRRAETADTPVPILVTGGFGDGRVTCLLTDLAPHWSGGWTDWGERAIDVGHGEELGDQYLAFVERLCRWTAGEDVVATGAVEEAAR